jgi:hypothetical protein
MAPLTALALIAFIVWVLLNMKTSRPDGRLVGNLHQYRVIMGYIMPTRNESVVYFDVYVDAEPLERYVEEARKLFPCDITHACIAAAYSVMYQNPTVNRFVSGHRLYERDGIYVSFSMKRARLDAKAKLATVKMRIEPSDTFRMLCERIDQTINVERSGRKTYQDKEFNLLTSLPRPILKAGIKGLRLLDYYNLLPASFIENDPLYTSMFVANLGSLGMEAGYHHLYEWGNCASFMMAGKIEEHPVFEDGRFVPKRRLHMRYSYDERVEDGLTAGMAIKSVQGVLGDPFRCFGCLAENGEDTKPIGTRPD